MEVEDEFHMFRPNKYSYEWTKFKESGKKFSEFLVDNQPCPLCGNRKCVSNDRVIFPRQQISEKINELSMHMDETASIMIDFARVAGDDWKEVLRHAFQLHGAAYMVKSWAVGILEDVK